MPDTNKQFDEVAAQCRDIFVKKLSDYSASWRIMRPSTLTDQIYIKARRIRTLQTTGQAMIDEGIYPEFAGIMNYGIVGLIQLELPATTLVDISNEQALKLYDDLLAQTRELMLAKNHDYGEAWREMRVSSFTDIILTKIMRIKQIEDHSGATLVSEGVDANYKDIINYSIFALIKLRYDNDD